MAVWVTRVRHGDVNRSTRPRTTRFLAVRREYSDDLFMLFKGQIDGLVPGARYAAVVSVEITTDTPAGCFGIGGAPGESVWIKVGATAIEPLPVFEGAYLRMNIDIGNQANGGDHAVVLGDIANSRRCEQSPQWERKSFPGQWESSGWSFWCSAIPCLWRYSAAWPGTGAPRCLWRHRRRVSAGCRWPWLHPTRTRSSWAHRSEIVSGFQH